MTDRVVWTLPLERKITIRRIEQPLRDLIARASAVAIDSSIWFAHHTERIEGIVRCEANGEHRRPWRFGGDRISVVIGRKVFVERSRSPNANVVYNVLDGSWSKKTLTQGTMTQGTPDFSAKITSYVSGVLAPGELFVVRGNVPQLMIHQLWDTGDQRAELDVARDAILELGPQAQIPRHINQLIRDVLPYAHGLFLALIRKERDLVNGDLL